jgi:glucose/arabinose dehydrogenase
MRRLLTFFTLALVALVLTSGGRGGGKNSRSRTRTPAQESPAKPAAEADYYRILTFPTPPGEVIEPGALDILPDGRVAVGTRRGEIWLIDHAYDDDPKKAQFTRFAHGLHEVLGLAYKDGWLYVTQRPDVTRIRDTNGDGKADLFEVVTDGWGISGDYHEYAFGSRFDRNGELWVALCLTGSFESRGKFRGWALKVTPGGEMVPAASGIRSPGGIGFNADGDVFFTDNQGPWNGACSLKQIVAGGFSGHPDSLKWYSEKEAQYLGEAPEAPRSGSRICVEAKRIPQYVPPAVQFPYGKMGQSASGFDCDLTGGKFGPFAGQLFVGDQTYSTVMRVFLEKTVIGRYQGACFPFARGFGSGIVPVRFGQDGSLFVGGTNRGWGSHGTRPFAVERLVWTGKVPFEIREMRAQPDGFELTFTRPIDPATAGRVESYSLQTFTYVFQSSYGSPEVDHTTPMITRAEVGTDRMSVRLVVDGLQEGHIHDLTAAGVRSADGQPLLHSQAYYTLNSIPGK